MSGNSPPSSAADEALWQKSMRIASVVGFYFFVSISLVFLNKNIMTKDFAFPLFITWYQLIVALIAVWILGELGKSVPAVSMIPPLEFDWEVAKKVMPLTVVFVGMVSFNNLCLLYVEVTFYQVVRSTTICFTIAFTYLILGQSTSQKAINASAVVMLGFLVGSLGEARFSWLGVIFGIISSAFVSLYSIYVKKIMAVVNNDQWRLLIYNTILSIILMFPTIFIAGEMKGLRETELLYDLGTWISMTITGIFGFLINIAVFLQIKYTSPLTNNISGTLKACLQTVFAILVYRNPITFVNAIGIILVIAGSFWYSQIRYAEMKDNQRKEPPTPLPTLNPTTISNKSGERESSDE